MGTRAWTKLSAAERAEVWTRWRRGEQITDIAKALRRADPSVTRELDYTGGIPPRARRRSERALSVREREEISRGLGAGESIRSIARRLGVRPPASAGRFAVTADRRGIERCGRMPELGVERVDRSVVCYRPTVDCVSKWRSGCRGCGRRSKSAERLSANTRTTTVCGCRTRRFIARCTFKLAERLRKSSLRICARNAHAAALMGLKVHRVARSTASSPSVNARPRSRIARFLGIGRGICCAGARTRKSPRSWNAGHASSCW